MSPKTIAESTVTIKTFVLIPIVIGLMTATLGWGLTWGTASIGVEECREISRENRLKIIEFENTLGKIETHLEYIKKSIDEIKEQK